MVDGIRQVFGQAPTAGDILASGFETALEPSPEVAAASRADIATDQFAISPYRRWLAALVGGKTSKFVSDLDKAEKDVEAQRKIIRELRGQKGKGREQIPAVNIVKFSGRPIKGSSVKFIDDAVKEFGGSLSEQERKTIAAYQQRKDTAGKFIVQANDPISKHQVFANILKSAADRVNNANAGKSVTEQIQEAEDKFTSSRTKFNNLIKDFNKKVPKKTELENMTGIQSAMLRRSFSGSRDPADRLAKTKLFENINSQIKNLNELAGDLPVTFRNVEGRQINTRTVLSQILSELSIAANRIINPNTSFSQAEAIAAPITRSLGTLGQFEAKSPESKLQWIKTVLTRKSKEPLAVEVSAEEAEALGFKGSAEEEDILGLR